MTERLRHAAYVFAALPVSLSLSLLAPLRGGPGPEWALLAGALAASTLLVAPRPPGLRAPLAGLGAGALFWALGTVLGGLVGGAGYTGVLYEPRSLAWLAAWASLAGASGAGIAWAVMRASPSARLAPIAAALGFWASQASLGPAIFADSAWSSLAWSGPLLALGVLGASAMVSRGYWTGLGVMVGGRLLLSTAPVAGGLDALSRLFAAVLAALAVSVVVAWPRFAPSPTGRGLAVAAGFALSALVLAAAWAAGVRAVVVVSGSMEPSLGVGDIAIVARASEVQPGDVILYRHGGGLVIHRVVSVGPDGITTKGDANPEPDPWTVSPGDVIGVMKARIPRAGAPLLRLAGPKG